MDLIYWLLRSSSHRGGDVIKGIDVGYDYVSQLQVSLYKVEENLVQHLQNYIDLVTLVCTP